MEADLRDPLAQLLQVLADGHGLVVGVSRHFAASMTPIRRPYVGSRTRRALSVRPVRHLAGTHWRGHPIPAEPNTAPPAPVHPINTQVSVSQTPVKH